jgi:uncharacterized protein YyaL (SSP411 family)
VLRSFYDAMESQPFGFAHLVCALDFYLEKPKEIVVVGTSDDANTEKLIRAIHSVYLPNKTMQLVGPEEPLEKISPLLQGKTQIAGQATVYVCHNFTCSQPATDWVSLKALLEN